MRHILITGSSGYIGRAFINAFGSIYRLRLFGRTFLQGNYEFVSGDIKNLDYVVNASRGVDIIVHLAAVTTDQTGITDANFFETNTVGTFNVLEAAVRNKVKQVVYGSSVCAVGLRATPKLIMETDRCAPTDGMYGYSKYLSERMCEYYAEKYGIRVICLRIARVVPQHELAVPNDPSASPHWLSAVHIDDVVEALRLAIDNDVIHFGIFHIAANSPYSKFDITKAKNILGYRPRHNFSESITPQILNSTVTLKTIARGLPRMAKDFLTILIKKAK